ncbi:MAG: ATP-binding protein [Chloroflexi bacterium]|nr:ATP-binding protein [Chloroflexota bacterium]
MSEALMHLGHIIQFDGLLHWCVLLALFGFIISMAWIVWRIVLPLRRLAKQANGIMQGNIPAFDEPSSGMREVEQLRRSLQYMAEQIRLAQAREVAFRNALTESQEHERMRIAREIHDDTIQSLVFVAHTLERAAQPAQVSAAAQHLETARQQVIRTVDNLRQLIADLRPTVLDELGLAVAIENLCEVHPAIDFEVVGERYELDHDQELAVFRAAQEAIYNAQRHAHAKQIKATLTYAPRSVTFEVWDDGQGFRIPQQLGEFAARGHYGLLGIRERMLHLGGQLSLISELAVGTQLTVTIPAHH